MGDFQVTHSSTRCATGLQPHVITCCAGRSALDVDSGGTLDKDELWCMLAVNGDDAATQMMDMVDLNGDGPLPFLDRLQTISPSRSWQ